MASWSLSKDKTASDAPPPPCCCFLAVSSSETTSRSPSLPSLPSTLTLASTSASASWSREEPSASGTSPLSSLAPARGAASLASLLASPSTNCLFTRWGIRSPDTEPRPDSPDLEISAPSAPSKTALEKTARPVSMRLHDMLTLPHWRITRLGSWSCLTSARFPFGSAAPPFSEASETHRQSLPTSPAQPPSPKPTNVFGALDLLGFCTTVLAPFFPEVRFTSSSRGLASITVAVAFLSLCDATTASS
mmetsp:Transcript_1288/g.4478  ORF Transcript_1288/g.4478 Transcript_1288/m.4478 type:complete len:248 (-) Transcript_1288:552-1295(-)